MLYDRFYQIEEITLQRDVPTPLVASPVGHRRGRSSSPIRSSIVGGPRMLRARVLSFEGRDRMGMATVRFPAMGDSWHTLTYIYIYIYMLAYNVYW